MSDSQGFQRNPDFYNLITDSVGCSQWDRNELAKYALTASVYWVQELANIPNLDGEPRGVLEQQLAGDLCKRVCGLLTTHYNVTEGSFCRIQPLVEAVLQYSIDYSGNGRALDGSFRGRIAMKAKDWLARNRLQFPMSAFNVAICWAARNQLTSTGIAAAFVIYAACFKPALLTSAFKGCCVCTIGLGLVGLAQHLDRRNRVNRINRLASRTQGDPRVLFDLVFRRQ